MALITISQSVGSGDPEIAANVAKKLNLELFDDNKLRERAKQLGIQSDDLKGLDQKKPGLFDRFLSTKPEAYLEFMQSLIYEVAKFGEGVIVGHGSQILLRDFGCALHVLIHAPESYRIENLVSKQGLSPEAARKFIRKNDNERKGFFNFAFNLTWDDPSLYDLVISTGKLGNEAAINLIIQTAVLNEIKACSLTALDAMERLSQERAARAALLKENINMTLMHLEVPQKGMVSLRGFAFDEDEKEEIIRLVRSVPGIVEVQPEISILRYEV